MTISFKTTMRTTATRQAVAGSGSNVGMTRAVTGTRGSRLATVIEPESESDAEDDEAVEEMALLLDACDVQDTGMEEHELKTAPLFTRDAYKSLGRTREDGQYGVLGRILSIHQPSGAHVPEEPRLYVNTNAPFSALVCGVQGSGKSHTLSVLLENLIIPDLPSIGSCQKPVSGLVLHYSEGGSGARPCEAAWIACAKTDGIRTPPVRVYVSESSFATMKKVYAPLGANVKVRPLKFTESELDAQAILSMMAIGSSDSAPLYMHTLLSIMRDLGEEYFNLADFLHEVNFAKEKMNRDQKTSLEQRLSLLNDFVDVNNTRQGSLFKEGCLTIIDLSDPFIDPGSACSIFEIATRLFVRTKLPSGKVLVVDEAHKYLSTHHGNTGLTKALLTLIREQRHLGMRVIISTQEPTAVPPVVIDLCNIAIFHRFSSPAWWDAVAKRVCADVSTVEGFERVVKLKTGQALVLCPSGLGLFATTKKSATGAIVKSKPKLAHLGRRYMVVKTRQRVTVDGGSSVLAFDA